MPPCSFDRHLEWIVSHHFHCSSTVAFPLASVVFRRHSTARTATPSHIGCRPSKFAKPSRVRLYNPSRTRTRPKQLYPHSHSINRAPDFLSVSFGYTTDQFVLGVPLGSSKTSCVPPGSHVARVRERANSWAEAEVRAKAGWRMTKSDRGEP
ncbi:hypothetical protein E5676_scaffold208G00460 [Cucumis melo var. makuwa]|uniref:NBS-LRR type resistance protein n=1 Tax=Cucumis melo var. makuwa TaxID=1194695 RepID=A0A5D3E230_CUCMM|nr:hypothetical protein E5676_scaffold208G00460 [Cucumis melo var. makuwa]